MSAFALSGGIALAVAWGLTFALCRGMGPALLDLPNARSLHAAPKPRSGGLAIFSGIVVGYLALAMEGALPDVMIVVTGCTTLVFIVSIVDDVCHVSPVLRLAVHAAAALGLVAAGLVSGNLALPGLEIRLPATVGTVLTVLFVVWMTNLYNFMDGMDGFAGGMGAIGFAACAVLAMLGGSAGLALAGGVVALACAGFLCFNFPPARIFMGDAGASVLGFAAAALLLAADQAQAFPLWIGILVFSPFVADATLTLFRRAWRRERIWEAHCSHCYQRLVQLGWSHRRTTLWAYALMFACAASALLLVHAASGWQWVALCVWGSVYAVLVILVGKLEG